MYNITQRKGNGARITQSNPRRVTASSPTKGSDLERNSVISIASKDYLLSQASIVCSVILEPNSFLINPETSKFVNSNGDCWSNDTMANNYQTFIGAFNYMNHIQEPEKSVGFIADAVLRRRYLDVKKSTFVYYTDILVATHRDHSDLVEKIILSEIQYLSMGCSSHACQCSRCGFQPADLEDEDDVCEHLASEKGTKFFDERGTQRIVAEILGDGTQGSCIFDEASWLTEIPASDAAIKRNVLNIPKNMEIQIEVPDWALERDAMKMYLERT